MNKLVSMKTMTIIFLLSLFCTPAFGELDPLEMYDDFNTKKIGDCKKCMDTDKWQGSDYGDYITEVKREIKRKRALLAIRSWGTEADDIGGTRNRIRMKFADETASITGVCFTPRVKKYKLNSCPSNKDQGSQVRMRYWARMYDNDDANDDVQGVVMVGFNFRHSTYHDASGYLKRKEFSATAYVSLCSDENCETESWSNWNTNGMKDVNLDFGKFKQSNKTEFCVSYDTTEHEMVFRAGNDERIVNGPDNGLPGKANPVHPNHVYKVLEARNDVANCTEGMISAYLEGTFDNVKIRREVP